MKRDNSWYNCKMYKLVWLLPFILSHLSCMSVPAVDIQAHRGGRDLYPENTLVAFGHALELGVDTLELDLALTRDGIPVVSHDPFLSSRLVRKPDGEFLPEGERILISEITYEDLLRYSVGEINPRDPYYYSHHSQEPVPGEKMPALADVFELVLAADNPATELNIEIKTFPEHPEWTVSPESFVDAVLPVIDRYHMEERVTIQSFDWRTLSVVKELRPGMTVACLTSERINLERGEAGPSPWLDGFDVDDFPDTVALVEAFGADIMSPDYRDIGRSDVAAAHERGIRVVPWTVNERAAMRRLIEIQVDGIITDRPDLLIEISSNRS